MSELKSFFKRFKNGTHDFAMAISSIINVILLSLTYLIAVGLTSVAGKLVKKRFLNIDLSKKKKSYWSNLNLKVKKIEEYYKRY